MLDPMIHDDAGKHVPLVRFNMSYLPMSIGPLPKVVQRAMRKAAFDEAWDVRNWFSLQALLRGGWIGLMPAIICNLPLFIDLVFNRRIGLWTFLVPFFLMIPLMYVMARLAPLATTDPVRAAAARVALDAGFCASCGYPLPASPSPSSERRVCSECGATWASKSS